MKYQEIINDMTFEDYRNGLAKVSGYMIDSKFKSQHDLSGLHNWKSERTEKASPELALKHFLDLDEIEDPRILMISDPLEIDVIISNAIPAKSVINPVLIFSGEFLPERFMKRSKQQGIDDVVEVLLRKDSIEYLKPYKLLKQQDYSVIFSQGAKLSLGRITAVDCFIVKTKKAKYIRDNLLKLQEMDGVKEVMLVS